MQRDSKNERFEDMEKGTFRNPTNRFSGYPQTRLSEPSETQLSDNPMKHGFNDFMTQCRQSPVIRSIVPPLHRIRDDPKVRRTTEADAQTSGSALRRQTISSTIKINRTMSNEIFVAFAIQKGGIGKSTVTALVTNDLHNEKGPNVAVVDCDTPQHSIHVPCEHETGLIDGSIYFKALDDAESLLAEEEVKPVCKYV